MSNPSQYCYKMNPQRILSFKVMNERANQSSSNAKGPHITAKGKEGKALRKKLAIAMGLKISSSGTPSTVDSDEELDAEEEKSQNVMEMFRKQMKETAARRKQPTGQQQVSDEASNALFRRTVHRRTTTTTTQYLSDDEGDMDEQERSRDRVTRSKNTQRSHDNKSSKSQEAVEKSKVNKQLTTQHDASILQSASHKDNALPSEETFSSYGDQNESSSSTNTSENSVKLLRDKIRKNARARRLPLPKIGGMADGKEKETIHFDNSVERIDNKQLTVRKLSGSQIPIRIERKSSVGRNGTNTSEEIQELDQNQKSRIPLRKSQNVPDRKHSLKKNDSGFSESLLTEIFSTSESEGNSLDKLRVDVQESKRMGKSNEEIVAVNVSQNLHSSFNSSSLFDSVPTDSGAKKDKSKLVPALKAKNILKNLRVHDKSHTSNINIASKTSLRDPSHNIKSYDFDAIESELAKLKASVFQTYDDLHEMKEFTLGLSKELREIRTI